MSKINPSKHKYLRTRVENDFKDVTQHITDSGLAIKRGKQSAVQRRRERKWIEMKRFYDKKGRWPKKMKERVRKGIPHSLRSFVWMALLEADTTMAQNKGLYKRLTAMPRPTKMPEADPFRTIDMDVPRTFPDNFYLHGEKGDAKERLREVLYAYCQYDKDVRYCQGMNLVAAFIMISCPFQNEHVFWMLERICNHPDFSMRDLYSPGLVFAFEYEYVLKKLVKRFLPKVYAALLRAETVLEDSLMFGAVNLFATKWVISLWSFVPAHCAIRIWDVFFNEGRKVLYRVALAVLKHNQDDIINAASDEGLESGEFMETLTKLKESKYVKAMKLWEDADRFLDAMFTLTHSLSTKLIDRQTLKFYKEKRKEQLEMELGDIYVKRRTRPKRLPTTRKRIADTEVKT